MYPALVVRSNVGLGTREVVQAMPLAFVPSVAAAAGPAASVARSAPAAIADDTPSASPARARE